MRSLTDTLAAKWILPLFLLCLSLVVHAAPAADNFFSEGLTASKSGNYESAIDYFLKAERAGKKSGALYHNLGVAYFKSGQYEQALQAFQTASEFDKLRSLSFYNIGLVEEKRGNQAQASAAFEKARQHASTDALRRLAETKLGLRDSAKSPYVAYLEAFGGSDSNPQLVDETSTLILEKESDTFFGGLAYGRYHFGGDSRRGAYVIGSGYSRRYTDVDEEDTRSLNLGAGYTQLLSTWRLDYQVLGGQLALGGDEIQDSYAGSLAARKSLGGGASFESRFLAERIEGDEANGYDYLSGDRLQFRARYGKALGAARWHITYELEDNDRGELITQAADGTLADRFDVSPTRHGLTAQLESNITSLLKGEIKTGFRTSEYSDSEFRAGSEAETREDDRWQLSTALIFSLGRNWETRLEVSYWENDSNFDEFDYERIESVLAVSRSFF